MCSNPQTTNSEWKIQSRILCLLIHNKFPQTSQSNCVKNIENSKKKFKSLKKIHFIISIKNNVAEFHHSSIYKFHHCKRKYLFSDTKFRRIICNHSWDKKISSKTQKGEQFEKEMRFIWNLLFIFWNWTTSRNLVPCLKIIGIYWINIFI